VRKPADEAYADRPILAFGNERYFPGRAVKRARWAVEEKILRRKPMKLYQRPQAPNPDRVVLFSMRAKKASWTPLI